MKKALILLLLALAAYPCRAQQPPASFQFPVSPKECSIFFDDSHTLFQAIVEEGDTLTLDTNPAFSGGEEAFGRFIADNIEYPDLARTNNVQGQVRIQFIIEKDGSISDIKVLRDIGCGCAQAVVRLLQKMPPWTPGMYQGQAVRSSALMPVIFSIKQ